MKNKIQIAGLGLLMTLNLTFGTGCKKPETTPPGTPGFQTMNATLTIQPLMENGMLKFESLEEFDKYQEALLNDAVEITHTPDNNGETPVLDDALKLLEGGISGFTSLRSNSVNTFELGNIDGWIDVSSIPNKHPLANPILESALNADGAVIIGRSIVMFLSEDLTVSFDKSEAAIFAQVREMPATARTSHINAAKWIGDLEKLRVMDFSVPSEGGIIIGGGNGHVTLGDKFSFSVSPVIEKDKCDIMKANLKMFRVQRNNNVLATVSGNFTINWGDGTSSSGSITLGNSTPLSHTYSAAGTYNPTIIVNAIGDGQVEALNPPLSSVTTGTPDCLRRTEKSKTSDPVYSSNGQAFIKGYALFRSSMMANNIQAETEYYEKNSNGRWKNVKNGTGKKIYAKIYGDLSFNSKCDAMGYRDAEELDTNKKSVRAVKRWGMITPIFTQIMYSYHYAFYGNEKIEATLELPDCQ